MLPDTSDICQAGRRAARPSIQFRTRQSMAKKQPTEKQEQPEERQQAQSAPKKGKGQAINEARQPSQEQAQEQTGQPADQTETPQPGADRTHFEGLGRQWAVLVGDPAALMPQIVGTVLHSGGTRPDWQRKSNTEELVLMAWPADEPLRAGVIMRGPVEGDLKPATAMPLMEGLPNDLLVDQTVLWGTGVEGHVGVTMIEGRNPLWFYDPLFFRDKEDLTPGVTHTFVLAGLALGLRRALLDEMTITQGPRYEIYAAAWLDENPGRTRLDVPPLKVDLKGKKIITPGRNFCEYEVRNTIMSVDKTRMDKVEVYLLGMEFGFDDREPLRIMVYAPQHLLEGYEPKVGDEVDAYLWLQGRVMDMPVGEGPVQ